MQLCEAAAACSVGGVHGGPQALRPAEQAADHVRGGGGSAAHLPPARARLVHQPCRCLLGQSSTSTVTPPVSSSLAHPDSGGRRWHGMMSCPFCASNAVACLCLRLGMLRLRQGMLLMVHKLCLWRSSSVYTGFQAHLGAVFQADSTKHQYHVCSKPPIHSTTHGSFFTAPFTVPMCASRGSPGCLPC